MVSWSPPWAARDTKTSSRDEMLVQTELRTHRQDASKEGKGEFESVILDFSSSPEKRSSV